MSDTITLPTKESLVSPKEIGKENPFDGKVNESLPNSVDRESKQFKKVSGKRKAEEERLEDMDNNAEISLPTGREFRSVAGVDMCEQDVGNALQFSKFCEVFGKTLDVKNGQAEYVLQDIFHRRTGRRGKYSTTVQFHIHLLSFIKNEQGEVCTRQTPFVKNSWFNVLKECLSELQGVLRAQGLDFFHNVADYETLDASQKLKLLNILCDEVLGTKKVRNWIKDQNAKLADNVKEAKQKLRAARDEEKNLKQKSKKDIADAIVAKHNASLSNSEHEAIVSRVKSETARAHAKVLESKGICINNNQKPDALRLEPIVTLQGHAYWKLNISEKIDVLCQNVGNGDDTLTLDEKWSAIDVEGKEIIEKHACSLRAKRPTAPRATDNA